MLTIYTRHNKSDRDPYTERGKAKVVLSRHLAGHQIYHRSRSIVLTEREGALERHLAAIQPMNAPDQNQEKATFGGAQAAAALSDCLSIPPAASLILAQPMTAIQHLGEDSIRKCN